MDSYIQNADNCCRFFFLKLINILQERIAKVDNAIESIVRSLGRRVAERKLAVALLLELSKSNSVRDCIGNVQGCILLLVTMSSSDDGQAARDAQALLENLSFSDQNVIQMAKANYFKYLLQRLSTGSFFNKIFFTLVCHELPCKRILISCFWLCNRKVPHIEF